MFCLILAINQEIVHEYSYELVEIIKENIINKPLEDYRSI